MRKYVALLGIVAMGTGAFASDITVYDGQSQAASGWYGMQEDQEVEGTNISCERYQAWDLEAFTLDGKNLGMVGGYNFELGQKSITNTINQHTYTGGDIFIALDNAPVMGTTIEGSIAGTIENTFGYDYAIKLNFNDGTYQVYSLTDNSLLTKCVDDAASNPWTLAVNQGSLFTTATNDFTFTSGLTDLQTGYTGGIHYAVDGIDLSFITGGHNIYTHYTMECGNDVLTGAGHVPEPGSLILFGTGLLGLIGFAFGRRKK